MDIYTIRISVNCNLPLILEGSFDQEIRLQLRGGKVSSRMGGSCLQSRVADLPEYLQP